MDDEGDYDEDEGGDYEDDEDEIGRISTKTKGRGADGGSEDDEGIAAWGSKKGDFYNADQIETEADALEEEEEAKKLQRKHLQAMNEQDFGFDETEWIESGKGKDAENEPVAVTEGTVPRVVSRTTDVLVGTSVSPSSLTSPPPVTRVLPMS